MERSKSYIAKCFVPNCQSSTLTTPEKIFFSVPRNTFRHLWFAAVGRSFPEKRKMSLKTPLYCCDVHFNLENDVEGWAMYKIFQASNTPTRQLRLKKGVLPHLLSTSSVGSSKKGHQSEKRNTPVERDKPLPNGKVLKIEVEPNLTGLERDKLLRNGEVLKIEVEPDLTSLADLENVSDPAGEEKPSRVMSLSQALPGNGCAYCGCCCKTKPRGIDVGVQVS